MRRRSAAEYDTIVADLDRRYRMALQAELDAQTNVDSTVEPNDMQHAIKTLEDCRLATHNLLARRDGAVRRAMDMKKQRS